MEYKKSLVVVFCVALLLCSSNIYAQELLTPKEAIKIALENNYSIKLAKNSKQIAENNYSAAKTKLLPTLDATGSYSKSNTNTKIEFYDGRKIDQNNAKSNTINAGVALNWTIFDGFKMFAGLSEVKELQKNSKTNLKATIENSLTDILSTYYDIVRQKQVLEVVNKNINISKERVNIAESKLKFGSGSKFDLLRAQVDFNTDKASLLKGQNDLSTAKIKLNRLLGRDPETEFTVSDSIPLDPGLSLETLKNSVEKNNSDILLAKQNKNLSELNLTIARSELYPVINLNLGYNFAKSESQAGFTKSNQNSGIDYGITASFNLFNGLQTSRKIENAQVDILSSKTQLSQVTNQVRTDLLNTYRKYKNSLELVTLDSQNLKVAEENVDIALEKLKLGNIAPVEFRETQTQMLSAKSSLVSAQYDAKVAETELLKLSGKLIQSDNSENN